MRIHREKVPGIRTELVHFPDGDRKDGRMGGNEKTISAGDLSSVVFKKRLVTKQMQNGAEDRGGRKSSKCPESATPILRTFQAYTWETTSCFHSTEDRSHGYHGYGHGLE